MNVHAASADFCQSSDVFERFSQRAERAAGQTAIVSGGRALSYGALYQYSARIAHHLCSMRKMGVERQTVVALSLDHGCDPIAAALGTLMAGMIYVPLDPRYPLDRLSYMLDHSESDIVVAGRAGNGLAAQAIGRSGRKPQVLTIDSLSTHAPVAQCPIPATGDAAAYILYTSGSSGKPKGILQTRSHLLHFADEWIKWTKLNESDRVILLAPFCHDASIPDVYGSLLSGAILFPYDPATSTDVGLLADFIEREQITVLHAVPTLYRRLFAASKPNYRFAHLRWVVFGGEMVRQSDLNMARKWFPHSDIGIIYGQTESTITSVWKMDKCNEGAAINIGHAVGATRVFVVDDEGRLVDRLGTGEVIVASDQVAVQYWRDEEATRRSFTNDTIMGRMYRTGDIGRVTLDGSIALLGRRDGQIKVRGHRVELAEVETALSQHPMINQSAVVARRSEAEELELHAHVVSTATIETAQLRGFLLQELPEYMVPKWITCLEHLPVLPNGKVDYAVLRSRPLPSESTIVPPATETESNLAQLWKRLLRAERVGANSDFFDLGGHSLIVMKMLSELYEVFHASLEFRDVLQFRTVRQLAQRIDRARQENDRPGSDCRNWPGVTFRREKREYYPVSAAQHAIYFKHRANPAKCNRDPIVYEIRGEIDVMRLQRALEELSDRHEILRTSFKEIAGNVVQVVHDDVRLTAEIETNAAMDVRPALLQFIRPFDLENVPLCRVKIFQIEAGRSYLMFDLPHILYDGESIEILIGDLAAFYERGAVLPAIRGRYVDYALWEDSVLKSGVLEESLRYWRTVLDGVAHTELPSTAEAGSGSGHFVDETCLNEHSTVAIERWCTECGCTRLAFILTALFRVLHLETDATDIAVGLRTSTRFHRELENVAGPFLNKIVVRSVVRGEESFRVTLDRLQDVLLSAMKHGLCPYERVESAIAAHNRTGTRLRILVNYQTMARPVGRVFGESRVARSWRLEDTVAPDITGYQLIFGILDEHETITLRAVYDRALCSHEAIQRIMHAVEAIVRDPERLDEVWDSRAVTAG